MVIYSIKFVNRNISNTDNIGGGNNETVQSKMGFEQGKVVEGVVLQIEKDHVMVDIGYKS